MTARRLSTPEETRFEFETRLMAYRFTKGAARALRERLEERNRCFLPGAKPRAKDPEDPQLQIL